MSSSTLDSTPIYTICAELKGAKGAINVLTFSKNGRFLFSGGTMMIDVSESGVTAISWLELPKDEKCTSICVGTGRGSVSLCPMARDRTWFLLKDVTSSFPFDFNNAVEAQAYDPLNCRLAVTSHSGQIKMFSVEKCVKITPIWMTSIDGAIPRGVTFFGDVNQSLLIHGLETGEMCCRDAQNANIIWTKTLAGGIGNAILTPDETTLIVDNLTSGRFDVYRFPASTPSMSFPLASTQRFIKQCAFGEGTNVAICGDNTHKVHIINMKMGNCVQSLESRKDHNMIQAVAATMASSRHLIAGGSTSNAPSIYIWEKKKSIPSQALNTSTPIQATTGHMKQTIINGLFGLVILIISYPNWSIFFWRFIACISMALAHGANILANFSVSDIKVQADVLSVAKEGFEESMKEAALTEAILEVMANQRVTAASATTTNALDVIFL